MPKRNNMTGKQIVVKTFLVNPGKQTEPLDLESLPYELIKSTPAVDIWSLGCLLFQFATGENLEPVTRDDDLTSGSSMARIMGWNEEFMNRKLQAVKDAAARDLIRMLLQPDPARRISAADALLEPYFQPPDLLQKSLDEAKEKKRLLKEQLEEAKSKQGGRGADDTSADMLKTLMRQMEENNAHQKEIQESLSHSEEMTSQILANTEAIDARTKVLQ